MTIDHNVASAAAHHDAEESSSQRACERAATAHGLSAEQAESCDDGNQGCPTCPWRKDGKVMAYPLEVESIGEDVYIVISRGHHDIHAFMRKVREEYDWPLGVPTHIYMKTRPARPGSGYRCFYDVVPKGTRGAWPATHTQEAWGADSYEAHAAQPKADAVIAKVSWADYCDKVARNG